MIKLQDIHPLSDFQRNTRAHVEHLKRTGRPTVLTIHGQAAVVVQDAESYQRLVDLAAEAAAIVGIQRGLLGLHSGSGEEAEDTFATLERELGIPDRE